MLFYILIAVALILFLAVVASFVLYKGIGGEVIAAGCGIISGFALLTVINVWEDHANDIAKVVAQQHRIAVFEERIESLNKRLTEFNYPAKSEISLDADSPWASMVNSLTEAETQLAQAKDERAVAIRSIEARKRGPMSGVVSFVGDYE
jgi:hypothetical protein